MTRSRDEIRADVERELQQRLQRRTPSGVRLRCVACNGINPSDALFCVHCGARFNAVVVNAAPGTPGTGA